MRATKSFCQIPFGWVIILMVVGLWAGDAQSFTVYRSGTVQHIELLETTVRKKAQNIDLFASVAFSRSGDVSWDNLALDFYQQSIKIQAMQADFYFANCPVSYLHLHLMFKATRFGDDRLLT